MPDLVIDGTKKDVGFKSFKKVVEVYLDKCYDDLKDGKDVKSLVIKSDEIVPGIKIQVFIQSVKRDD